MPNTIADNLQRLTAARTAIGNAIVTKGGTVNSGDGLEEFPADIMSIKNDLTSIDITENGTYYGGEETVVTSSTFPVVVNDSNGTPIRHVDINGNTTQNGTPTPSNPVDVNGAGVRTENLYNSSETSWELGILDDQGHNTEATTSHFTKNLTRVSPNTNYFLSGTIFVGESGHRIYFYDNDKNWISRSVLISYTDGRFTTPSNCAYIQIQVIVDVISTSDWMLNEGSTAKPFEPYGYKITISNGQQTTNIYLGSTQVTWRIKKLVFNGTEVWSKNSSSPNNYLYYISYSSILPLAVEKADIICTHFIEQRYPPVDAIGVNTKNNYNQLYVNFGEILNSQPLGNTPSGVKQFLAAQYAAGTPVTIWYVLATPETAVVNEPLMKIGNYADSLSVDVEIPLSQNAKNNIDIDTTVKPSSASFTYNKLSEYIGYNEINVNVPSEASTLIPKTITENGTYNPSDDSADGYSSVVANVPNTYVAGDEGKVVNNGALVAQTAMSGEITVNDTYDTTLYNSITVNVTEPTPAPKPGLVRFMDYDGTILHTYTANEFLALSAMPENPTHEGLTSQGWNWSFEDAVEYVTTNRNLDIGQSYVTDDGRTRIYVSLENPDLLSPTLGLYLGNASVDVDWGDGSEHDTMTRTSTSVSKVTAKHTYPAVGNYVISIAAIEGTYSIGGSAKESQLLTDNKTSFTSTDAAYILSIKKVEIGNNTSLFSDYAFGELRSLETITLPVNFYDFRGDTFHNCYSLKAIVIPKNPSFTIGQYGYVFYTCQSLTNVSLSKESYICGYMFYNCYNLTRITIPLGRTIIGDGSAGYKSSAFSSCYNLSDVTIPEGITEISPTTFQDCDSLTHITLPSTLSVINDSCFYKCNLIGELELPASLTSIGGSAFYYCLNLNSVVFENGTSDLTIGGSAFSGCTALDTVKLPTNLKTIRANVFSDCSALKELDIPDSVTSIGIELCKNCGSLVSVKIGSGITTLPSNCFRSCASLTTVDIPATVKTINENAFYECKTLKTVTLHDGLQEITGGSVFNNCISLESIELPDSVTTISGSSLFSGCSMLKHVKLPKSLTTFNPGYIFNRCYLLTSFTLPETVTTPPSSSSSWGIFDDCWSLVNIDIPSWLTTLGQAVISDCYSLTELTIPSTVTTIASYGIREPGALKRLRFISSTPPAATASSSFTSIPNDCVILVPSGAMTAYTTATNYPNPNKYTYLVYGTYESGATLPSSTTDNYMLIWYASTADAIAETNPITTGNGNEVYARCLVDTSVTRSIDFDNNTSTLSGDPSTHPIYTNTKRCTVQDDGTITSYYGDANYVEDGSIGQVMVYIPKFYYKVNIINKQLIDDTHPEYGYDIHEASYSVSNIKYQGYKLHPAFINANGDEVDYALCSAFEGSTYDTSALAYNTNDAQTVDFTANTGDLLASIGYVNNGGTTVHVKPASGLTQNFTRPNSMTIAKNRGAGWYALTFKLASAIQMLITVEYGCNSQVNIADGVVGITDNGSYNCASYVGSTVGNTTGRAASTINEINGTETTYTSATTTSVNYRGIENMWGNIWKWVDGINIHGNGSQRGGVPYVCTDMNFSDTNTANYESVGFTVANTDGYVKYFGWGNDKYDWVFMPSTAGSGGASASTTVGDYFYKTANLNGYRAARLGGSWSSSSSAGVFYWFLHSAASTRNRIVGARLMYIPS